MLLLSSLLIWKASSGGNFISLLVTFRGASAEEVEPDVLEPEGVEASSIKPAFSNRVSKLAPTFCPVFIAARKGLSLDDVVEDDPDELELEYGMVLGCE